MIYALGGVTPEIDPGAWIAPNAVVIGKVRIAAGASIWFGAVLRGDCEWIEVGEGANVQDNSVLHTDPDFPLTIGRGVTVGHRAILHGCTIGDHALVGMGATLLNGAVLERESLLGAGALLTEGKRIPPGQMALGSPARIARPLTPEEITGLHRSGDHYRQNGRRFASGLAPTH